MKKIAVILLNWKGADDTIECIASLNVQKVAPPFQIVVVDNASGDGSSEQIAAYCEQVSIRVHRLSYSSEKNKLLVIGQENSDPAVTIIDADSNLGFCLGNNLGAKYAFSIGADAALILNNDTVVEQDLIESLADATDELGDQTLISPQILYAQNQHTIWWFGGSFKSMLRPRYGKQGESRVHLSADYPKTDWVSGCATLITREIFEKIGLYDPVYFIWCEEWDLSLRASKHSIDMRVAPNAIVYHKVGRSLGIVSPLTFFYSMRNMIILRRRFLPWLQRMPFMALYIPHKAIHALKYFFYYRDRRYLLGFWDALFDGSGGVWKRHQALEMEPEKYEGA